MGFHATALRMTDAALDLHPDNLRHGARARALRWGLWGEGEIFFEKKIGKILRELK